MLMRHRYIGKITMEKENKCLETSLLRKSLMTITLAGLIGSVAICTRPPKGFPYTFGNWYIFNVQPYIPYVMVKYISYKPSLEVTPLRYDRDENGLFLDPKLRDIEKKTKK